MDIPVVAYIILALLGAFSLLRLACWWADRDMHRRFDDGEGYGP